MGRQTALEKLLLRHLSLSDDAAQLLGYRVAPNAEDGAAEQAEQAREHQNQSLSPDDDNQEAPQPEDDDEEAPPAEYADAEDPSEEGVGGPVDDGLCRVEFAQAGGQEELDSPRGLEGEEEALPPPEYDDDAEVLPPPASDDDAARPEEDVGPDGLRRDEDPELARGQLVLPLEGDDEEAPPRLAPPRHAPPRFAPPDEEHVGIARQTEDITGWAIAEQWRAKLRLAPPPERPPKRPRKCPSCGGPPHGRNRDRPELSHPDTGAQFLWCPVTYGYYNSKNRA